MPHWKCQLAWGISEVHKREEEPPSYVPDCKLMTADMQGEGSCELSSDTDFPLSWQTVWATARRKQVHRTEWKVYLFINWNIWQRFTLLWPIDSWAIYNDSQCVSMDYIYWKGGREWCNTHCSLHIRYFTHTHTPHRFDVLAQHNSDLPTWPLLSPKSKIQHGWGLLLQGSVISWT